jgi:serine/threonine protein phosphatase PrpC
MGNAETLPSVPRANQSFLRESPALSKTSSSNIFGNRQYAVSEMQGWRLSMEDSHVARTDILTDSKEPISIFGVFDGHGGPEVSRFIAKCFVPTLLTSPSFAEKDYQNALIETFLKMDDLLQDKYYKFILSSLTLANPDDPRAIEKLKAAYKSGHFKNWRTNAGSTACVVLMVGKKMYVANAGDSRCILATERGTVQLTTDHKPELDSELERIHKAGGLVANGRVLGGLNLTRSIGDFKYKRDTNLAPKDQIITALPDVFERDIQDSDEFILIGCDGVYESWENEKIVDYLRNEMKGETELSKPLENLLDNLVAPSIDNIRESRAGHDNMTTILINLKAQTNASSSSSDTEHQQRTINL